MEKENKNLEIKTSSRSLVVAGLVMIFGIFGSIVAWGFFSRIDTVVIAQGKVVLDSYKKPVEYKDWAVVRQVMVKEGDTVKAGQVLVEVDRLEEATMKNISQYDFYSLLARRDRLMAEKELAPAVSYSSQLRQAEDRQMVDSIVNYQNQIFRERRQRLENQLQIIEDRINQSKQRIEDLLKIKQIKSDQLATYKQMLQEEKELLSKGLSTKDRVMNLEEKINVLTADIKELEANIQQEKLKIEENLKQKDLAIKDYTSQAAGELQEVLRNLNDAYQKMDMYNAKVERSLIRADVDGQVMGLKVFYPQQVIKPGDIIMYIVPAGKNILVDGILLPQDRDKVRPGMQTDINFPSFVSLSAKNVQGRVVFVSDDTVYDEGLKAEVYRIKAEITPEGMKTIRDNGFEIVAGMPAVMYIRVEKVSPFEYILQPVYQMIRSSFKSN